MITSKFIKIDLKNKIIASLVGFLAVIFCLVYFVVLPTIMDIKTMGDDIEAQRVDLEKKYIKGQSLRQLTENLKNIEPKLNLLDQIFINKNLELEFISSLENEANKNQISQKINLSSPQATENQDFQKINLQLFTAGNFVKQLKYLMDIESLKYYINIKSLELSSDSGSGQNAPDIQNSGQELSPSTGETNSINMDIEADTYWH